MVAVVDMRPRSAIHSVIPDLCTQGHDHICCVMLHCLDFLCCPHKPESVPEVSKQGLRPEEEVFTRYLLTCVALDQDV